MADFPFHVHLKEDVSFQETAFPFLPKKRAWLREQLLELERSGVIERCPTI